MIFRNELFRPHLYMIVIRDMDKKMTLRFPPAFLIPRPIGHERTGKSCAPAIRFSSRALSSSNGGSGCFVVLAATLGMLCFQARAQTQPTPGPTPAKAASPTPAKATKSAPTPSPPAEPADLGEVYAAAMAAFQAGDYAGAAAKLESVIAKAGPGAQLETVFWMLGSCYFNAANYPKAIEVLNTYLKKFPAGTKSMEARFSIAQANYLNKNFEAAATGFKELENSPAFKSQALLYEGLALQQNKDTGRAAEVFQNLLATGIVNAETAKGAMALVEIFAKMGQVDQALSLVGLMRQKPEFVDNFARLNGIVSELGDRMLKEEKLPAALAFYRTVSPREEVIRRQNERAVALQHRIDDNVAAFRTNPSRVIELIGVNNGLKAKIEENKKTMEEFEKLPDFGPAIMLRIAACFSQLDKPWEAIVVYNDFLERYPEDKNREAALYALTVASIEAGRGAKARELCEQYLKDFPQGPNADSVGYMLGASAFQANDPMSAETYFGRMLKERPASQYKEEMRFLLANVRMMLGKFDEAEKDYQQYLKDFPKGSHVEEVTYRLALCPVFAGRYESGMNRCLAYIKNYPVGEFLADAKYRLAVCKFAANVYDEVLAGCKAWKKEFPDHQLTGEVLALEADCLAAKGDDAGAIAAYQKSWKVATTDEVVNYSLFAAQKLMQKKGDWEGLRDMFTEFVKEKPGHPSFVMGIYWIGKAQARLGQVEEAKKFLAETAKKTIADPRKESVEQLLSQLAQLCLRKKPPAEPAAGATPAVETASPTPAPDPGAELDELLGGTKTEASPTAKARVLFAQSELARLRKKTAEMEAKIQAVADGFKPEDLSAMLLAVVGDFLLEKKQVDKAAEYFSKLRDEFPKSEMQEFAYNGLGEIAYRKGSYDQALQLFADAIDKAGASAKLKEVTMGRAKSLLALGRLDEARKVFELVAGTREWRGEATAFAVYSLGEIAEKRGDLPGAIANYQRVYVGYQRYLPWVAKAYIRSAACFEKLNKVVEAQNTYREMLRNEKLAPFPEYQEAKKHLAAEGQGGQS